MTKSCSLFLLLLLVGSSRAMEIPLQEIAPVTQPTTVTRTPTDIQKAYDNLEILRKAIYAGSVTQVQKALENVPDVNLAHPETLDTPLHFAFHVIKLNSNIIALLLSRGASETAKNRFNNTPLQSMHKRWLNEQLLRAIENNESPAYIARLLEDGANPKTAVEPASNKDVLYLALSKENYTVAKLLLDAGANAKKTYDDGNTALHVLYQTAKGEELVAISNLLLQKGASLDAKNNLGQTPAQQTKNTAILNKTTDFLISQICGSLDQ